LKQSLKKAQQFSINLFEGEKRKLEEMGGIVGLRNNSILALRADFYREDIGVTFQAQKMEFYNC